MNKPQQKSTTVVDFFQPKNDQVTIFTGFDRAQISPLCQIIDYFVDKSNLPFFDSFVKSDKRIGGRPANDYRSLFKVVLYATYCDISIRQLHKYNSLGSEFRFLSDGMERFPVPAVFTKLFKLLDDHIDEVFYEMFSVIKMIGIEIDTELLYGDGTIFEAHNSRHKVITRRNVERSKKKWTSILQDPLSTNEEKSIAEEKMRLNAMYEAKLNAFGRDSYGRTDEECSLLQDKNKSYIAGYNAQFIEEAKHGLVVFCHLSNGNPDCAVFEEMIDPLFERWHPKIIVLDAGYGTPRVIKLLLEKNIQPITSSRKIVNAREENSINEFSFELSNDEKTLYCPTGRSLKREEKVNKKGETRFASISCDGCEKKEACIGKQSSKRKYVYINVEEFIAMNKVADFAGSPEGVEYYSHRGNRCESPNGFMKRIIKGKKFEMIGLIRNRMIIHLYAYLYNLTRILSITREGERKT